MRVADGADERDADAVGQILPEERGAHDLLLAVGQRGAAAELAETGGAVLDQHRTVGGEQVEREVARVLVAQRAAAGDAQHAVHDRHLSRRIRLVGGANEGAVFGHQLFIAAGGQGALEVGREGRGAEERDALHAGLERLGVVALVQLDQREAHRWLADLAAEDLRGVEGDHGDAIVVVRDALDHRAGHGGARRFQQRAQTRRGPGAERGRGGQGGGEQQSGDEWGAGNGAGRAATAARPAQTGRIEIGHQGFTSTPGGDQPPPSTSMNSGLVKASAVDAVLAEVAVGELRRACVGARLQAVARSTGKSGRETPSVPFTITTTQMSSVRPVSDSVVVASRRLDEVPATGTVLTGQPRSARRRA